MATSTIPAVTGVTPKTEIFTSTGSFTTPANVTSVEIFLVGGGGASGGLNATASVRSSGGGGGGGVISRFITVTPSTAYTITIGAGGTGNSGANGSNGSDTTFGLLAIATGGGGGQAPAGAAVTPRATGGGSSGTTFAGSGGGAGGHSVMNDAANLITGATTDNASQNLYRVLIKYRKKVSVPGL
jgi:hypothetical protein